MSKVLVLGGEGYLGSQLVRTLSFKNHEITSVDLEIYGSFPFPGVTYIKEDYARLGREFLRGFETIILLCSHSSVPLCLGDPSGSHTNNVVNFRDLCNKLDGSDVKLIYASSASVCNELINTKEEDPLDTATLGLYDQQKRHVEEIANLCFQVRSAGLRFGTLTGASPNPRLELMVNSMVHDAVTKGKVTVTNSDNVRSILGIRDACEAIAALVEQDWWGRNLFNLASASGSIGSFGEVVAQVLGAELESSPGMEGYSFTLNTSKFRKNFNFTFQDTMESLIEECKDLTYLDKSVYNRSTNLFSYPLPGISYPRGPLPAHLL